MTSNCFLLPIEDPDTFHLAIVYEKIDREKCFCLFVGDEQYPSFDSRDPYQKDILICLPSRKERLLVDEALEDGYLVAKVLDPDSIVPVIRALKRKYPNAFLSFAIQNSNERRFIKSKLRSFPWLELINWNN